MLSLANATAGWWTSAAVAAIQRQQRAWLRAALGVGKRRTRRRKTPR